LYRLDRSRSTSGSGLGLAMVKAIAGLHGLTIRLEDAKPGLRVVLQTAR
jgi:signal transduction histidine kinase